MSIYTLIPLLPLAASITLALFGRRLEGRGHRVVLAEASDRLGGRFALAAATAEPNAALLRWYEGEMERSGVDVRLETALDAQAIRAFGADRVFVVDLPGL